MSDQQETDRFDTKLFIDEVQRRPAIWDMASAVYKDRVVKKRCWDEVVEIFCSGSTKEKKKMWVSEIIIIYFLSYYASATLTFHITIQQRHTVE